LSKRWVYWLLCAAALGLVITNVAVHLRGAPATGADSMKSLLSAAISAKVAVLADSALEGSSGGSYGALVVQALDQAEREGSPPGRARALRRKAIWCDFEHLGCADAALDALAAIAAAERAPAPADEADVLREVLGGAPIAKDRVAPLEARIAEIRLGWFDHLLRERLHRNAGEAAMADADLAAARGAAAVSVAVLVGFGGLLAAGAVAWLAVAFLPARRRAQRALGERLREPEELSDGDAARLLALFVAFLAAALLLGPALRRLGIATATTPLGTALQALAGEVALGLIVVAVHRALSLGSGAPPPALGFKGSSLKRALGAGSLVYLLLLPAIFAVLAPISALFERLGIPTQSHPIVDQLQASAGNLPALLVWLAVASVAAPLLEEAVFRGALLRGLRARVGGRWAVGLSSVAFAIIHPQVGLGLVGVLVIGLVLALLREHERSLWPSVVVHALNNGVALAVAMGMLAG
jgi:membrane protease YdiL (CAAX protease family)